MGEVVVEAVHRRDFAQYVGGDSGYRMWFQEWVLDPVRQAFERLTPGALSQQYQHIQAVENGFLANINEPYVVPSDHLPLIKRAALHYRKELALRQERLGSRTVDPAFRRELDSLSTEIDAALALSWLRDVDPMRRPRLTDYINLERARAILEKSKKLAWPERFYDEKFGILWAPGQWRDVVEMARIESWLLGTSTVVAYVDIDDFKTVNSRHTETVVDREVLPPLMLLLEAQTWFRGFAFRFGGDEYLIVFPNVDGVLASRYLDGLRAAVEQTTLGPEKLTLSIGYHLIDEDSPLTNSEVLARANCAKNEAKRLGKNRVEKG